MIRQLKRSLAISLLGLAVLPAGSAFAQSDQWNSLYDRIIRLEAEVRRGGGAGAGGGNGQIQAQLQQLSAQMNAMAQQIYDMQRELNRLRELERQGLLFKKKRKFATAIAPQQQSGQWDQGQVAPAPNYGRVEQSVEIERAPSAGGQLPRGGLAPGPQVLGTLHLDNNQAGVPAAPAQPSYQQPSYQQPAQPSYQQPAQPLQPQQLQPRVQQWQQSNTQPRQVQGVQSQALPPIGGGQSAGVQQPQGQPRYQLQQGPQAYRPEAVEEPSFDAQGRPSLAPEKVETALLDGSAGGNDLGAGSNAALEANNPDNLFKQAQSSYRSRDFSGAVSGFRTFVTRHRQHELADDAQFLLGEAYYAQGSWKQAAQSYLAGYQNFPKSDKRGSNLLKLGMSLNKLGQKKKACSTFAEVNKKFGKQASLRNSSLKEMQRAGCS